MSQYKQLLHVAAVLVAAVVAAIAGSRTTVNAQAPNPYPSNPYQRVDWPLRLPADFKLGHVVAADVGPDGNIYVAHRCGLYQPVRENCIEGTSAPILKIDPSGKLLKAWGEGLMVYPNDLVFDRDGSLWVTDAIGEASVLPKWNPPRGNQILKFDREGKLLMALGTPGVAGLADYEFRDPSGVAFGRNGEIYVADGEGRINARIVKFTKDGKFVKAWGSRGSGLDNLDQPHAIAVDSKGRVFVADRRNNRVMILDADLQFVAEWRQFGRPSGLAIDSNDVLYVADSQTTEGRSGFRNGIFIGRIADGMVMGFIPAGLSGTPEGIAGLSVDTNGNIWGSGGLTVFKFVKR